MRELATALTPFADGSRFELDLPEPSVGWQPRTAPTERTPGNQEDLQPASVDTRERPGRDGVPGGRVEATVDRARRSMTVGRWG